MGRRHGLRIGGETGTGRAHCSGRSAIPPRMPQNRSVEVQAAIAVDWSGARDGGGRRTWLAEVSGDELVVLQNRWKLERLFAWLIARAERDHSLVLGLDFAFSFPAWFV